MQRAPDVNIEYNRKKNRSIHNLEINPSIMNQPAGVINLDQFLSPLGSRLLKYLFSILIVHLLCSSGLMIFGRTMSVHSLLGFSPNPHENCSRFERLGLSRSRFLLTPTDPGCFMDFKWHRKYRHNKCGSVEIRKLFQHEPMSATTHGG